MMQTFLPYPDCQRSARCLDDKRLGKQRVEAVTIYRILTGRIDGGGYRNHPATKMWAGYPAALAKYYNAIRAEWIGRGFKNSMELLPVFHVVQWPRWFGLARFHESHQAALLRKLPEHYSQFGWGVDRDLPYYWPTKTQEM